MDNPHRVSSLMAAQCFAQRFETIEQALGPILERVEQRQPEKESLPALETGFTVLDHLLSGLPASSLVVIAGLPGSGKTGLALAIARHLALKREKRVAIFSPKASTRQVAQRLLAIEAEVDAQDLVIGSIREDDWPAVAAASNRLAQVPIYICDTPDLDNLQLRVMTHTLKRECGLDLVIVDALHLVALQGQEKASVGCNLKALAAEMEAPVMVTLQLDCRSDGQGETPLLLAELEHAGYPGLERAADAVLFARRLMADSGPLGETILAGQVTIAKNRHGMTGSVRLAWNPQTATYME